MKATQIPLHKTGFFSKILLDYLNRSKSIQSFYGNVPSFEGFQKQIEQKQISQKHRDTLVASLQEQYQNLTISNKTADNIELLKQPNTFTVTTGHQLNLFTGPLYVIYKMISTINLCEELSIQFPQFNFVPIYWMATEDHDFEEINFFNFKGKRLKWNSKQSGGVGQFDTDELDAVYTQFSSVLNLSKNADELRTLFQNSYLKHQTLSEATQYLVNELFGQYGLVSLDADRVALKRQFIPYLKRELLEQTAFKEVSQTIHQLKQQYTVQVNPREINLFYLFNGLRERIVLTNGAYQVHNTELVFSKEAIINELTQYPERFSPNVIMRPLYQEVILPNIAYIGGGNELAYWLELKHYFNVSDVCFPILILRNSVQLVSKKQAQKLKKLNISFEDLLLKQQQLIQKKVLENTVTSTNFSQQKHFLQQQFDDLRKLAEKTDPSFIGAVNAQEKKQLNGLQNLEKRWLRAEKRRQQTRVNQLTRLQDDLLPNQALEERQRNFAEFYEAYGQEFINGLKENLNPLEFSFTVLEI